MRDGLRVVAVGQGGVFTRRQALAAGYSERAVKARVHTGVWVARRRGVYVDGRLWEGRDEAGRHAIEVAAAIAALREGGAVASHHSAARLHGLSTLWPPAGLVTLTRPPGAPGRGALRGVRVERAGLPPEHVRVAWGVPVTTPARTVVDLARRVPFAAGVTVADSALYSKKATRAALDGVLLDCAGWPGTARASAVLGFADPRARSPFESITRVMFAEQGLPPPQVGVLVGDEGGIFTEVDFLWAERRTIAEADGLMKYTSPDRLRAEKLKQERLEELGYTVVRLTWQQVTRRPQECAARIRRAFSRAE